MYERERAYWILNHAGIFGIQRKRGQEMLRQQEDANRKKAGLTHNPHVHAVTDSVLFRSGGGAAANLERFLAAAILVIFGPCIPLGKKINTYLEKQVPTRLASVPILLLTLPPIPWLIITVSALPVLKFSSWWAGMGVYILTVYPAGIMLMTAMYGFLNGWLAIPGWDRLNFRGTPTTQNENQPKPPQENHGKPQPETGFDEY